MSGPELLVVLPILIPFVTAIGTLVARRNPAAMRWLTVVGTAGLLVVGLLLVATVRETPVAVQMGNWPAPFGITLVADLFSAIMVALTGIMGFGVAIYALVDVNLRDTRLGFYTLYNVLLTGVSGAFVTGDLFNLYVWFEVLLIASFVLLALEGKRSQLEGALKYVTLNLFSSALFLSAVGLTYGLVGSLNMADIAQRIGDAPPGMVTTIAVLFLVAFGIKSALFPLFTWLPASYHTPPVAVTAIFSGLMTKVGVYAILRVFSLIFVVPENQSFLLNIILGASVLTMISGVLGAVAQTEVRRLLSFHIVSQIGYLIMGIGLFTPLGFAATIFFMGHVIIAKSALFLVSGLVQRSRGSFQLDRLGGIYREQPMLAMLFLVPALALSGIPPLSGFWAKFALIRAGLESEAYVVVGTALVVSVLTLFSMTKIWARAYWSTAPDDAPPRRAATRGWWPLVVPTAGLALLTIFIGFLAGPLFDLALSAATQLADPTLTYIPAVLP
jgi:multicomponent Na+:H+ antiporter subunit D